METDHTEPPADAAATTAAFDTVHAPALVVGDRGAGWIVEGWDLFKLAWPGWLLLALVGCVWLELVDSFPFLQLLDGVLAFVISAGLLLACQANYQRRPVQPAYLLAGFRLHFGRLLGARLVVLGLSLLITTLGLGDLLWQILRDENLQLLVRRMAAQSDFSSQEFISTLADVDEHFGLLSLLLRFTLILLLIIPVSAAGWFAPALIVLGNCDVKTALLYSLQATMKNLLSLLIYGLLLLILSLLALLPWHIGYLLLIPVFQLSVYLSYRDIFVN